MKSNFNDFSDKHDELHTHTHTNAKHTEKRKTKKKLNVHRI